MTAPGQQVPFRHRMKITRYVYIPMRDGTRIAADIYRPEGEGEFPALLVQTPYNKNRFDCDGAARYIAAGYAICVVDTRGTGGSEGEAAYYDLHPEILTVDAARAHEPGEFAGPFDGYDCVEWLAAQEFCDGNVGTFGGSALGVAQLLTARAAPPHLKAMFVQVAPGNYYLDRWFPGGIHNVAATVNWQDFMTENISPARPVEDVSDRPGEVDPEGDEIRASVRLARLRLRGERTRGGRWTGLLERFLVLANLTEMEGLWREYHHAAYAGGFDIPIHHTGIWFDHFVRGTCETYREHSGPKRLTLQPGSQGVHGAHGDIDMAAEHIRWFDHWLKGIDTGMMAEPQVRAFVMGSEKWRGFSDWPPPEAKTETLALSAGGDFSSPDAAEPFETSIDHDPEEPIMFPGIEDLREYESRAHTFTTAPLPSDLTVIGEPKLTLKVKCSSQDGHLYAKLTDVHPDGRSRQVTNGRIRLALRGGFDKAVPMTAGEASGVTIDLWPVANTFKAGHRLRLVLAGSEAPTAEIYPEVCAITIVSAKGAGATLELPVVE